MSHQEPMLPPEEQPYVVDQPAELRDFVSSIIIVEERVLEWTTDCAALVQTFPEIFERDPQELWLNPVWYRRAIMAWRSGCKGRSVLELEPETGEIRLLESDLRLRVVQDRRIPEAELHLVAQPPTEWEFWS